MIVETKNRQTSIDQWEKESEALGATLKRDRESQVSEKQRERGQKSNQRNKRIRDRAIKSQKL